MMEFPHSGHALPAVTALAAMSLGIAACAGAPPPSENISIARASVQRAEQAGAPELAPAELSAARDKLARAEKAAAGHQSRPANDLAEQANADAQLAEANAQEQRSHKAASEFDASLRALRDEALRGSAPAQ